MLRIPEHSQNISVINNPRPRLEQLTYLRMVLYRTNDYSIERTTNIGRGSDYPISSSQYITRFSRVPPRVQTFTFTSHPRKCSAITNPSYTFSLVCSPSKSTSNLPSLPPTNSPTNSPIHPIACPQTTTFMSTTRAARPNASAYASTPRPCWRFTRTFLVRP